jgi:phospholipid-binding lipoprotein MlaA
MRRALAAALGCALLAYPAGAVEENAVEDVQGAGDTSGAESSATDDDVGGDPLEPLNRSIFSFNEALDRHALEPVATGWDKVVPEVVQTAFGHFFDNLALPVRFANDLLQAKPVQAYETFWRAVVNTTFGLGGFLDVASMHGIVKSDEDFGQTLGYWGTPPGPYLVLPLLGPSSPRDTVGLAVDSFGSVYTYFVPFWASAAARAVDLVNDRASVLETIREERAAAFDWYAAVRNAHKQYRENRVRDRAEDKEASDGEDLYHFEEDVLE